MRRAPSVRVNPESWSPLDYVRRGPIEEDRVAAPSIAAVNVVGGTSQPEGTEVCSARRRWHRRTKTGRGLSMAIETVQTDAVRFRVLVHSPEPWWADQLAGRLGRLPVWVAWTRDREAFLSTVGALPYLRVAVLDLARAGSAEKCLELVAETRRRRDTVRILALLPYGRNWLAPYLYCAGVDRVFVSPVPPEVAELVRSCCLAHGCRGDRLAEQVPRLQEPRIVAR